MHRVELDSPDIDASLNDPDIRLGGWVAGLSFDGLRDDDRSRSHVIYIGALSFAPWSDCHWLIPSSSPRLIAHVVGDEIAGALISRSSRFVPARAAAVDLAELGGAREKQALRIWNR